MVAGNRPKKWGQMKLFSQRMLPEPYLQKASSDPNFRQRAQHDARLVSHSAQRGG